MLALVGSGEYLTAMEPIDRTLIERLAGPVRVVCLPTAAGTEGDGRIAYWSRLGVEHFTRLQVQVQALPVIDRASANDPALADAIAAANFVYLSGGRPDHLYVTLVNSLAWKAIVKVLDRGGLLAGCSAGAMIMGEKFFGFGIPVWKSGFKFLPGVAVIPHFDEIPQNVTRLIRAFIGNKVTLIGIEGNTALVKDGDEYEVLGSGGVTIWTRTEKSRFTSGALRWPVARGAG